LQREFRFKDFAAAINFVNALVDASGADDHRP